MSQLNANPSASWGPFSGPITSSDYDITDAFDLLTPPAVTQGSDNHPTSSALFYSLTNPVQTHGAPISGPPSTAPEQLEKRPSTQPDTAASALSLDSDDGPTSASDQRPKRSGSSRYTTEVKLAKNREAQRRFRLKQKARSSNIQAQLANTAAKVQELEQQKHQLEASNMLLRQSSQATPSGQAQAVQTEAATSQSPWTAGAASLPGMKQDDPHAQLSAAWTDHIHQLGSCLLQMDGSEDPSVHTTLQRLTSGAMTLVAQLVRTHGKVSGPGMHNARIPGTDAHFHPQPNDAFYAQILANLNLSEAQAQDLLFLRRLFLTRRCVLSIERKVLMRRLAATDQEVLNPTENILAVERLTHTLKENAAEDHELYYKIARATFRGILSTRQVAELMVHAYPYVNVHEALLESLATHRQALSKDAIMTAAQADRMTADHAQLLQYCEVVGANVYSGHLPLSTCCPNARLAQ